MRVTIDQAVAAAFGVAEAISSPRAPASRSASGSRKSASGTCCLSRPVDATQRAVSETWEIASVIGRGES